eukprot:TRINITY_DN3696_c0_g1_i1.p1 TRINITY_DN3696_c0_g1~~TRINITY_DN3696_c0_g1_i1.p1  ORF type:complete len:512 (-),score=80.82 TRINITY_DN3696_c0_g1_i1:351-1886(-)
MKVLCLIAILVAVCLATPRVPTVYTLKGSIIIPSADVNEPFVEYHDEDANRQRIDYYDGLDIVYRRNDLGYTQSYEAYMKSHKCFKSRSSNFDMFLMGNRSLQMFSKLPTQAPIRGVMCDVFEFKQLQWGNVYKVYTVYFHNDTPMRFTITGTSDITFEYTSFIPGSIPESTFEPTKCDNLQEAPIKVNHIHNVANPEIDDAMIEAEMFLEFAKKHDKIYSGEEHSKRQQNFADSLLFVESFNRQHKSYSVAINQFADMSDEEFKKTMLPNMNMDSAMELEDMPTFNSFRMNSAPSSVDWRTKGKVTPVKNQAICGSCWSFASAAVLESQYAIKNNEIIQLAPQSLMDCAWEYNNNACNGGIPGNALIFAKEKGIAMYEKYGHYLMNEGTCHLDASNNANLDIKGVYRISNNQEAVKNTLAQYGPLAIAIDAELKSFRMYHEGVYSDSACSSSQYSLDHAVTLVGYGSENGSDYWIVKNSWAAVWGDEGYIKIGMKNNLCGVTDMVVAALL